MVLEPYSRFVAPALENRSLAFRVTVAFFYVAGPLAAAAYWLALGTLDPRGLAELALAVVPTSLLAALVVEWERRAFRAALIVAVFSFVPMFVLAALQSPFVTLFMFAYPDPLWDMVRMGLSGAAVGSSLALLAYGTDDERRDEWIPFAAGFALLVALVTSYGVPTWVSVTMHQPFFSVVPYLDASPLAAFVALRFLRRRDDRMARFAFAASSAASIACVVAAALAIARGEGSAVSTIFALGQVLVAPVFFVIAAEARVAIVAPRSVEAHA
jgi:hypothetical protein